MSFKKSAKGTHGVLDRLELGLIECSQPGCEPHGPPGSRAPEESLTLVRESEIDAASIFGRAKALDKSRVLEAVEVAAERGWRNSLYRRKLGERQPGASIHEREEIRLESRDPQLLRFLSELSREPKDDWPKLCGNVFGAKGNGTNH